MATRRQAVVTGASQGIGKEIALRLSQAGYEVWALARSLPKLEELAMASSGTGRIRPLRMDAEREDDVLAATKVILEHGVPYALVNNAGIALAKPLGKTEYDDYRRVMTVNVGAPFLLCRALMPPMAEAGGGRVVNIASTAALKGFKYTSAYCASKHALLGLTRALAVEFAPKQLTVNAICPGWTDTQLLAQSAQNIAAATGRSSDEARTLLARMNPLGRLVQPAEVAELCLHLLSPHASAMTGAAYPIDGGETA